MIDTYSRREDGPPCGDARERVRGYGERRRAVAFAQLELRVEQESLIEAGFLRPANVAAALECESRRSRVGPIRAIHHVAASPAVQLDAVPVDVPRGVAIR